MSTCFNPTFVAAYFEFIKLFLQRFFVTLSGQRDYNYFCECCRIGLAPRRDIREIFLFHDISSLDIVENMALELLGLFKKSLRSMPSRTSTVVTRHLKLLQVYINFLALQTPLYHKGVVTRLAFKGRSNVVPHTLL